MIRKCNPRARRGAAMVEAAILYPVFLLLLLGMLVVSLGMFRYSQLSSLTWEAARWASVRGPDYQNHGPDHTKSQKLDKPATSEILAHIEPRVLFGLRPDPSKFDATLDSDLTEVTLGYVWRPEYNPSVDQEDEPGNPPMRLFDPSGILMKGSSTTPTLYFRTD